MPSTVDMQERKVRREEKRAKQRAASITRAAKMHEARLADQSALNVDDHVEIKGEETSLSYWLFRMVLLALVWCVLSKGLTP